MSARPTSVTSGCRRRRWENAGLAALVATTVVGCVPPDDGFDRALSPVMAKLEAMDSDLFTATRRGHESMGSGVADMDVNAIRSQNAELRLLLQSIPRPRTAIGRRRVVTLAYLTTLADKRMDLLEAEAAAVARSGAAGASVPTGPAARELDLLQRRETDIVDSYMIALVTSAVLADHAGDTSLRAYLERQYWSLPDSVAGIPLTRRFYATADSIERHVPLRHSGP